MTVRVTGAVAGAPATLADLWHGRLTTRPNDPFIVAECSHSAQEFGALIDEAHAALQTAGVQTGDLVALQGPLTVEHLALHFALQLDGAINVPLLPGLTATESSRILAHCSPRWVVGTAGS